MVGSHLLLDLVRSGNPIRAIYRSRKSLEAVKSVFSYNSSPGEASYLFETIEWIEADLTDIPALERAFQDVGTVYHCAAYISFDPSEDSKLRKINIEGTANVVNLCISEKVDKLCFVSSIATFDKKPGKTEIDETSLWNKENDHSMYAITKYGAEMEVWRASQEGVPVVIVNPGVIIGPGFWNSGSGLIFKKVHYGLKYRFPKVTGFVGVEDVVKAMRELTESSVQNEKFIVVAENCSFREVLEMAAAAIGQPAPTRDLKPWMVLTGWIYESTIGSLRGKKRHLSRQSKTTLFEKTFYNSSKLQERIDFEFQPLEEIINRTGSLYKKELTE